MPSHSRVSQSADPHSGEEGADGFEFEDPDLRANRGVGPPLSWQEMARDEPSERRVSPKSKEPGERNGERLFNLSQSDR